MSVLDAQTVCSLARQTAKCTGYTVQSGQLLNAILEDLAQTYDFDVIKRTFNFVLNSGGPNGSGPYPLPADWYRGIDKDIFYVIDGVPYAMINVELNEYDRLVQTPGFASQPTYYATDMSSSPPNMFVWPPSSGAFPVTAKYYPRSAVITTPETSSSIPWFPNSIYLMTRLAGELCKITNDKRWIQFLGDEDTPGSAENILQKYLKMKDDRGGKAYTVQKDRRVYNMSIDRVRNTKTIGW